jgi:tRNA C32,U32 (ribose-2'-O)-methylase TrmJ
MDSSISRRFVVVLNETQDLVNIAATIRAMMNMGLYRLRLVRPVLFDAYRIAGIAHGSEPYLEKVEFFDTLDEAIADAIQSVGFRVWARRRAGEPRSSFGNIRVRPRPSC